METAYKGDRVKRKVFFKMRKIPTCWLMGMISKRKKKMEEEEQSSAGVRPLSRREGVGSACKLED